MYYHNVSFIHVIYHCGNMSSNGTPLSLNCLKNPCERERLWAGCDPIWAISPRFCLRENCEAKKMSEFYPEMCSAGFLVCVAISFYHHLRTYVKQDIYQ